MFFYTVHLRLPLDALLKALKEEGIHSFHILNFSPNEAANLLKAGWRVTEGQKTGKIILKRGGLRLLGTSGRGKAEFHLSRHKGISLELPEIKKHPIFVIDLGLWHYHTEEEKISLINQIKLARKVALKYLSPDWLFLSRPPALPHFSEFSIYSGPIDYLLDPSAEEELRRVEPGKVYCIGGIADKSNRMRTAELGIGAERVSLRFFGRAGYVPNRIHQILEILGRIYSGSAVEEAIAAVMPRWLKRQIRQDLRSSANIREYLKLLPYIGL